MATIAWNIAPRSEDNLVSQLLVNRGVAVEHREHFLYPDWERDTHSPFDFTQMPKAVAAMFGALERGDAIVIHGDYDADGVSGSALLFEALRYITDKMSFTFNVEVFLPDREKDGYGVAMHTIERFIDEKKKLLVTVDCGIANGLELDRTFEAGIDVVICDHHQMGTHFPGHAIVLHPLAPGETYANKTLCGTGVAFKFASALIHEARNRGSDIPEGYEKWFLDFVAIATVTDVMPILGENRVLETFGLQVLNKTRRPGLRAMLTMSGTDLGTIDTTAIGFRIGPRLNAAGRLSSAKLAFDTLTAQTAEAAEVAATKLESLNKERQSIFKDSYKEAEQIAKSMIDDQCNVLVVASDAWLPGIVGLIAGRLVNDFALPAFALTKVGDHYVGSGRTAGGLHLVEAMNACGDIFIKKGGHPQACGLSVRTMDDVHEFRTQMNVFARSKFGANGPSVTLPIDAVVTPSTFTIDSLGELNACAPFGEGNRPPIFAALKLTVMIAETMGSTGTHLRLTVLDDAGKVSKMIGFGMGDKAEELVRGRQIDIAYEPGINEWNGRKDVQCRIVDIRL
ncbi:MAG: single-stranded-DNA-specific exonuclease RecJ [Patescibacteria group bacterium]